MTTPTPEAAPADQSIASLNGDGTKRWFIPPYVIPAVLLVAVAARTLLGA